MNIKVTFYPDMYNKWSIHHEIKLGMFYVSSIIPITKNRKTIQFFYGMKESEIYHNWTRGKALELRRRR